MNRAVITHTYGGFILMIDDVVYPNVMDLETICGFLFNPLTKEQWRAAHDFAEKEEKK